MFLMKTLCTLNLVLLWLMKVYHEGLCCSVHRNDAAGEQFLSLIQEEYCHGLSNFIALRGFKGFSVVEGIGCLSV